jgi:hypothetical protein
MTRFTLDIVSTRPARLLEEAKGSHALISTRMRTCVLPSRTSFRVSEKRREECRTRPSFRKLVRSHESGKVTTPVDHGNHNAIIASDGVDDPIGPNDQFADVVPVKFRDACSTAGKPGEASRRLDDLLAEFGGIGCRVATDEVDDRAEVI